MKKKQIFLKICSFYFLISIIFTIFILGFHNLSPTNLNWLLTGDRLGELIGWLNFKNSDWSFPLGVYDQGDLGKNSVVFNGTVPLLALIFKLLFKSLNNFQYFSFWILFCIFLQGLISYLIINKLTNNIFYSIIGSLFFITSPIFIHRIGMHISLAGHWIILLYFLNYLFYNKNFHRNNILIIVLSTGIHFYFSAILFLVDLILYFYWFYLRNDKSFFFKNLFLKVLCLSFFMYCLGYFTIPFQNVLGGGFGTFKMNILSFIDPGAGTSVNKIIWSNFISDIPNSYGEHEGFNYFGLGFIFILVISTFYFLKNFDFFYSNNFNLYFSLFLLITIISISNNIGFADKNIFSINLNKFIMAPLSLIRASGRFFWIVNYFLLVFSLLLIFKYIPKKKNILILSAILIQLIDISGGLKEYINGNYFKSEKKVVKNKIWDEIEKNFETISSTYLINPSPEFYSLSGYLVNSNLSSELIASARYNREKFIKLRYSNYVKLYNGNLGKKLFVISGISHFNFLKNIFDENDNVRIGQINDNWIIYESKNLNLENLTLPDQNKIESKKVNLDEVYKINFSKSFNEVTFLGLGWTSYKNSIEPWTDGSYSSLIFDLSTLENIDDVYLLDINFGNKLLKKNEYIELEVTSNGYEENQNYKFLFNDQKDKKISIKIKKSLLKNNILIVNFKIKGIINTDFDNLIGIDQRKIGLKINSIEFTR